MAVFGLCLLVLVAWSLGHESGHGSKAQAEAPSEAADPAATASLAITSSSSAALGGSSARIPETRPAPRLRAPHEEDGPPGLEIAIQDRDGHALDHFHEALTRAARGEGQARLLFYGASHTASDLYTGVVRSRLQEAFGDAGHGFVLPVPPWRSYRHQGLSFEAGGDWTTFKIGRAPQLLDHYGLAGVAVETSDAGAYGVVETKRDGNVSSFDLYYLAQPSGGAFDVLIDGERVERVRTAADQRRPAYATFHVEDGPHSFKVRAVGDGLVRIFGVALERAVPGVLVDTLGINGSRARNQLYWEDHTYREHLRRRRPDLVVLAYGTNESGDLQPIDEYMEEVRQVLTRVRETVPEASCLLVGPSDRPVRIDRHTYEDRPRTAEIIEAQWRLALEAGCAFFDTVAFQGGPLSAVAWNDMSPPYGAPDHVHFTRRGYERYGEVLLGALLEGFEAPDANPDLTPVAGPDEAHASR